MDGFVAFLHFNGERLHKDKGPGSRMEQAVWVG